MGRTWQKGCLCGCLYPEECRYYEWPAQTVEHVYVHHVIHHAAAASADDDVIDVECIEISEISGSQR